MQGIAAVQKTIAAGTAKTSAFPAPCGGVSERILKKTAFFTVEDSLQLAAGNLQLNCKP
jgi:hypothetical protein